VALLPEYGEPGQKFPSCLKEQIEKLQFLSRDVIGQKLAIDQIPGYPCYVPALEKVKVNLSLYFISAALHER
jgi:hypothetical protein